MSHPPLLCYPLDFPSVPEALGGAALVSEHVDVLKVGLELFIEGGPQAVKALAHFGKPLFLDLKLHDIPQTVENAVSRACDLGVRYLTIHTSGGTEMIASALRAVERSNSELLLLGVTVLTSLDTQALHAVGVNQKPEQQAALLAGMAAQTGLTGFVCSAQEVSTLRQQLGPDVCLVTPGIRTAGSATGDQRRVATPGDAVRTGSSMLVVGRPIRDAVDPAQAALAVQQEMREAFVSFQGLH